jgi:hypothetical protein
MPIAYELLRVRTRDAGDTTVYVTRHPLERTTLRVVCFLEPTRLDRWCVANGEPEAIVAGFFLRDPDRPLGEVVSHGQRLAHEPVAEPWGPARACVHVDGAVRLARRSELPPVPAGDLVQSATLIHHGHLLNRPYSSVDQPAPESRPVVTALLLTPD